MEEDIRGELGKFLDSSERLIAALENHSQGSSANVGTSQIHYHAGGIGVLIVTGMAAFMAGLCFSLGIMEMHQQKQIDDLHDYLNVVYQYAPQLKPKDFK
jgi:hypothetical protein